MADAKPPDKIIAVPLEEARRAWGSARVAMPRSKVASLRAFRRIRMDRVFGAIGIVITLIGVALMFYWEAPPVVEKKYKVEWPTTAHAMENFTKLFTPAAPTDFKVYDVKSTNVTMVTVTASWSDDVGTLEAEGDRFRITVDGPEGTNIHQQIEQTYRYFNWTYNFALSGIPDLSNVPAANEAQAKAAVGDRSNRTGTGEWKVTVVLVKANHHWKQDVPSDVRDNDSSCVPATCDRDPGEDITITFRYETYSVKLSKLS